MWQHKPTYALLSSTSNNPPFHRHFSLMAVSCVYNVCVCVRETHSTAFVSIYNRASDTSRVAGSRRQTYRHEVSTVPGHIWHWISGSGVLSKSHQWGWRYELSSWLRRWDGTIMLQLIGWKGCYLDRQWLLLCSPPSWNDVVSRFQPIIYWFSQAHHPFISCWLYVFITANVYALKTIFKSKGSDEHIERETRISGRVKHPFIVPFYGYFETEYEVCYLMQWARGGDLFSVKPQ